MDQISVNRIQKLHPKLRDEAMQIMQEINEALTGRAMFRITFTLRTMSEQLALYNQGRTAPGNIVTNAKPGTSYHNYGLALDFCLIVDGKEMCWSITEDFDNDHKADWMEVVAIFEKHGWEWGGRWHSIIDNPHFQKTFGLNWSQLLLMHNQGKVDADGYVKI